MIFSDITDFKGIVSIPYTTHTEQYFIDCANQWEEDYLKKLLNDSLYNDLIADLDVNGDLQTQKYKDLIFGKNYTDTSGKIIAYEGLLFMMRYFIYCEFMKIQYFQSTTQITIIAKNENATITNEKQLKKSIQGRWSDAVYYYRRGVKYIEDQYELGNNLFSGNQYSYWRPENIETMYDLKIVTIQPPNYNTFTSEEKYLKKY